MENLVKAFALALVVLVVSGIGAGALPAVAYYSEPGARATPAYSTAPWWTRLNITFEEAVDLAYSVRNVTYPAYEWAVENNVTVAQVWMDRGNTLLEKAFNLSETNETLATAYAFVASLFYAREPLTAYKILGDTIRENLGVNNTVTNETVEAVLAKAVELKGVVGQAIARANDIGITVPDLVNILIARGDSQLNLSQELLSQGYVRLALGAAIRGYHLYVRAYGVLVKAVYVEKLGLPFDRAHALTHMIIERTVSTERIKAVLRRLPERVRERLIEKWMEHGGTVEAFKRAVREIISEYRVRLKDITEEQAARIITRVILIAAHLPGDTGAAIRQWKVIKHIVVVRDLYQYVLSKVRLVAEQYNLTGLALINKTLEIIGNEISSVTGHTVNLVKIFYASIVVHVIVCHRGRH